MCDYGIPILHLPYLHHCSLFIFVNYLAYFRDLEKNHQVYVTKEHTDIINAIDGMGGNTTNCGAPEIVTGSRDGKTKRNYVITGKPFSTMPGYGNC